MSHPIHQIKKTKLQELYTVKIIYSMFERVLIKTAIGRSDCQLVADGGDIKKLLHILISIVVAVWEPRFSSHTDTPAPCIL